MIIEYVRRRQTLLHLAFLLMEVFEEMGTDRGVEMLQDAVGKQADIIARGLRREIQADLTPLGMGAEVYRRLRGGRDRRDRRA